MCCFAAPLPLRAMLLSLHTHTILFLLTSFWRLLSVSYYLSHDTPDFYTFHKLGTILLLPSYTILVLVIMFLLGHLFYSVSLLFSLVLLLSFSSTLAALLVTWPCMPPLLFLLSSTFFLLFAITVVLWTSSHILYGLPLHQKSNVSKATC